MVAAGLCAALLAAIALAGTFSLGPYVVTGIADGAIYALAALGLVLTFKTSGIFNFAIGAQAAASAYVFYSLRVTAGLPWPVAALGAMLVVGLGGSLLLERMAYWLTGRRPAAMKVVATIGLLVLLQSTRTAVYGVATFSSNPSCRTRSPPVAGQRARQPADRHRHGGRRDGRALSLLQAGPPQGLDEAVVDSPTLLTLEATEPVTVRRYAWAIGSCFISISGCSRADPRHRRRPVPAHLRRCLRGRHHRCLLRPADHLRRRPRHRRDHEHPERQAGGADRLRVPPSSTPRSLSWSWSRRCSWSPGASW